MPRIPRCHLPDGLFHVTARSIPELPVFGDAVDRRFFLALLSQVPRRFGLQVHAYCLMGTHYHLVVEGTTDELSTAFRWLNGVYAREHNARHGRRGHLLEERFASWLIRDEHHLAATIDYVLANPVRAGLVDDPADWPWSWAADWTPRPRNPGPPARSARNRPTEHLFASTPAAKLAGYGPG